MTETPKWVEYQSKGLTQRIAPNSTYHFIRIMAYVELDDFTQTANLRYKLYANGFNVPDTVEYFKTKEDLITNILHWVSLLPSTLAEKED